MENLKARLALVKAVVDVSKASKVGNFDHCGVLPALHRVHLNLASLIPLIFGGRIIGVNLLHLMCRIHAQGGSPQLNNMLANLTTNHLGHLGAAWLLVCARWEQGVQGG